jgi:hypothetical protein
MKTKRDLDKIFNSESPEAHWEILNHDIELIEGVSTSKTITLHYVPQEDYSKHDLKITMPHEHFYELINYLKTFK